MIKKVSAAILAICLAGLAAAGCGNSDESPAVQTEPTTPVETNLSKLDMSKWKYNKDDKMYYQMGVLYCETPADEKYEKLSVFVPEAFMDAADNSDGTFTCELSDKMLNGYSAATAPIVMPIDTPGYYASKAWSEDEMGEYANIVMEQVADYTSKGFVFVHAGCRGIDEGAPTGVTDLKAAIRYVRYCDDVIAGDAENIFVYGMSGGGAQAAILGASGDSGLYDPYLESIGAVKGVSDAVAGSMDWCPITDLDTANAEYEWMMGCTRAETTAENKAISDGLANKFAEYVNSAGFTDKDGNSLTLTESKDGIYQSGSYYEYVKSVIERSLNNYLSDTDFSNPELHNSYGSAKKYVDDLNSDGNWVTYDETAKTASITSVADFAKHCKTATNLVVAFDQPQGVNPLFGTGDGKGCHFDKILADVLTEVNSEYASSYTDDLKTTDSVGNTVEQRVDMYTPLYYLMKTREGCGKSTVAKYWRIRTGIEQQNTSVTTEINLALALENYDGVKNVDFETVWLQGHTEAERTGDSTSNFIAWVNSCVKG